MIIASHGRTTQGGICSAGAQPVLKSGPTQREQCRGLQPGMNETYVFLQAPIGAEPRPFVNLAQRRRTPSDVSQPLVPESSDDQENSWGSFL